MGTGDLPAPGLHGSHNGLHFDGILIDLLGECLLFMRLRMRQRVREFFSRSCGDLLLLLFDGDAVSVMENGDRDLDLDLAAAQDVKHVPLDWMMSLRRT